MEGEKQPNAEYGGATDQNDSPMLAICQHCDFVEATAVDDYEQARATEEDPAFLHYDQTGHNCGSFEPNPDSPLYEKWDRLYKASEDEEQEDLNDIADVAELWRLATGQEAEA